MLAAVPAFATDATLVADTHVNSAHPATNYGSISNLYVGGTYTGLLQFGPRYRWKVPARYSPKGKPTSLFGEAMIGGVKGFDSIFPASTGSTSTASALATQIGFGVDLKLKPHLDLRPLEVSWVRMQLPNSTTNVQNDLRVSTGIVLHY